MKITTEELYELLELARSENNLKINHTNGLLEKERQVYNARKTELINEVTALVEDSDDASRPAIEMVLTLIKHTL
jgi:hypothetical protein